MFEKIGRLAEAAASNVNVSRRGFMGGLGRAALAATGVLGALLVLPGTSRAAPGRRLWSCTYNCGGTIYRNLYCMKCPTLSGCSLVAKSQTGYSC